MSMLLILVTAGPYPMLLTGLSWGIGLAAHGFFGVIAPRLRERWEHEDDQPQAPQVAAPAAAAAAVADDSRARSLEELSAAIAHEIRNPITAAKSLLQQIVEEPGGPDTARHSQVALEELDRVERSIAHLLRYAREQPFAPSSIDMLELIEGSIELLRERAVREGVQIVREWDDLPMLYADGEQLRQVLANLIGNALDALAALRIPGARIEISAGQNLAGNEVWIRVRDNGPGVSLEAASKLFRPFFTTKPRGTGLGLSVAKKIVERHGGTLELTPPAAASGAEFVLHLPRLQPGAPK
ncbi:MAG TPA: ATP-binding protein [Polyangiales bacterium]|nr:ATP-binding protein [Polyangiales bacterium]